MKTAMMPETTGFDPVVLIEAHQNGVWRYLRALGCEPSLADDLTQDTFLAILQRPFEDFDDRATAAYLRRVAHNLLISHYRRAGKVTSVENIEEFDTTWEKWAGNDNGEALLDALAECVEKLTDRARLALDMRFRDRGSRAEIAAALEISEHGAKNLMQRAKKQLRECVEKKVQ